MSKGKGTASQSDNPGRDILQWNDEMDQALLNALREEDHKGNRLDGGWTAEGYNNVVEVLRSVIDPTITKNHIKNRLKTLKAHFGEAHDMFHGLSGFSWNSITRKFQAEDEVWADLIRVKPHAAKWKKHPIKNYDILKELFETDRAAGKQTKTAKERRKQLEKESIDLNNDYDDAEIYGSNVCMFDEHQFSNPDFENVSPPNGTTNSSADTHTSKGEKRKRTMAELVEEQYEHMNEGIMTIAEALKEGNAVSKEIHQVAERQVEIAERQVAVIEKQVDIAEKQLTVMQQTRPRHYSESDVWELLDELRVFDDYRMKFYDHLCDNEHKKRKIFGVPRHMRAEALFKMMNDAGLLD